MKETLLAAVGLMLVLEGILPFAAPKAWRETFRTLMEMSDGQIRTVGFASMMAGLVLLALLT